MEMDIYMRRRLVALGGLVAFFILFVLLVKSCGDDDEAAPLETTSEPSEEAAAVPLTLDEYIVQADAICGPANRQVGALDPNDANATQDEFRITKDELRQLQALELDQPNRQVTQFLDLLTQVVAALRAKAVALDRNDTTTAEEAQVDIDTNEAEARALGEQIGFVDCGQFLDAGQAPADAGGTAGTDTTGTDTGAVAPTDTGAVTTPPAETTTPPAETTTPAPTDDSGGITP